MARGKRWEPSDEERKKIETYAGIGLTQEQIATIFNTSVDSIKRKCSDELKRGKAIAIAQVAGWLFQDCRKDRASRMFFLKTQAGWREKPDEEHSRSERIQIELVSEGKPLRVIESERKRGNGGT